MLMNNSALPVAAETHSVEMQDVAENPSFASELKMSQTNNGMREPLDVS